MEELIEYKFLLYDTVLSIFMVFPDASRQRMGSKRQYIRNNANKNVYSHLITPVFVLIKN